MNYWSEKKKFFRNNVVKIETNYKQQLWVFDCSVSHKNNNIRDIIATFLKFCTYLDFILSASKMHNFSSCFVPLSGVYYTFHFQILSHFRLFRHFCFTITKYAELLCCTLQEYIFKFFNLPTSSKTGKMCQCDMKKWEKKSIMKNHQKTHTIYIYSAILKMIIHSNKKIFRLFHTQNYVLHVVVQWNKSILLGKKKSVKLFVCHRKKKVIIIRRRKKNNRYHHQNAK